ncbi:MAG: RDD family protein [Chloroflexi bacterium]|nr:RDD family protein [Chloroflexota bacterium]
MMTTTDNAAFDPYNLQGQYAGFVTRFIAFLLDIVVVSAVYTVSVGIGQLIGNFFNVDVFEMVNTQPLVGTVVGLAALNFPVVYYVFFWSLIGQTPGKALMGIRIYGKNGQRIGVWRAFVRYVGYWVSAVLLLGYLWVLIDNRRQSFHDKLARTVVVYSWEARIHQAVIDRAKRRAQQR